MQTFNTYVHSVDATNAIQSLISCCGQFGELKQQDDIILNDRVTTTEGR